MLLKIFLISLNVVLPGLGTLFMGKVVQGIVQLLLAFIGFICMMTIFPSISGLIIWVAAWVRALVVRIQWVTRRAFSINVRMSCFSS